MMRSVRLHNILVAGATVLALCVLALATACAGNAGEAGQALPTDTLETTATAEGQPESSAGLVVVTQELSGQPTLDPLSATTVEGEILSRQDMIIGKPFQYQWLDDSPGMWAMLGNGKLVASEQWGDVGSQGYVTVTRDGEEIYRIDTGTPSPISYLQGFFVYDGHWVLETNHYNDDDPYGGQLTVDGVLLNEQEGYEKAFNAQTIDGKLFYLFQRDGKIDAWYDGQVISLGYDSVWHYACCSGGEMDPVQGLDAVSFFGVRDGTWYLTEIGTPAAVAP
jgi:hypothetical protein